MCIIAAKPTGIPMPNATTIENMWYVNSDGAGFMYAVDGKVHIEKGFMRLNDLTNRLKQLGKTHDLTALPIVMHFRITTHGGTKPENTHPFPISDNIGVLKKLHSTARIGVAHNGIIDITPRSKDISDTMEYIASQLAPLSKALPNFYENKYAMQMIDNAIGSKMAFLTGDGKLYTIGQFVDSDGVMYSNNSYRSDYWHSKYGLGKWGYWDNKLGKWVYDDDDDWTGEGYLKSTGVKSSSALAPVDYYEDVEYKKLVDLDLLGAYLVDEKGEKEYDTTDLYLDRNNHIWFYDAERDVCYSFNFYTAWIDPDTPATWDIEMAEEMPCLVNDEGM